MTDTGQPRMPAMLREGALLLVVLAIAIAEHVSTAGAAWLDWRVLFVALAAAAVGTRRRYPILALIAVVALGLAAIVAGGAPVLVPLVVLIYSLGVTRGVATSAIAAIGAQAILFLASVLSGHPLSDNITGPLALAFAVTIGWAVRNRQRYREATAEQAEAELLSVAADERSRIGRELHDVLAHSLSVMVRLADGADAVIESDRERARTALRNIGRIGRDSLVDVRGLLGALGESGSAPQPALDDLEELAQSYHLAGLPVELSITGQIDASEGMQLVIFRTVQESLTNALRHSESPTRVSVTIGADASAVVVEVVDDGRGRRVSDIEGSRRGLTGLRERAAIYGGVLTAGPRDDGVGWAVRVRLPRTSDQESTA